MKSPFTGKDMKVHKEERTMSFRKEEFNIVFHAYRCDATGELFEDDNFAMLNYNQLVNQYRTKHAIPFPEQIISIREKYGLSAAKMSEILGFGTNGYRNYENGEVPSISNARLIQSVEDPAEFKKMVMISGVLEDDKQQKLVAHIDKIIDEQQKNWFSISLESFYFGDRKPSSLTGFKSPNSLKLAEMIVFFTEKLQPFKTKLNKLLFYADFMNFANSGYSISGVQYKAINMGPVPNNFNSIFEYYCNRDAFDIQSTSYPNGAIGEKFLPNKNKKFDPSIFSEAEICILESVANRFQNTSTSEIIEISHAEKAWKENEKEKRIIDYKYAFDLLQS